MTIDATTDRASVVRGVFVPVVVALLIGGLFVGVFLAAFHDPKPRHLPVALVAPPAVAAAIESKVAAEGDALQVRSYTDRASALTAVRHRNVLGAFVVTPQACELLVAGANGPSLTQTLQGALGGIARASGSPLRTTDVASLPRGDSRGLSTFYGAFGVVLAGFLFGLTSMQLGRQLAPRWRSLSAVLFSAAAGLFIAWLIQPVFGALPAPFLSTAATVSLLALAVSATTAALLEILGPAGTFVAAVVLLVFGNATSTGILPAQYLPAWLEPLTSVLPVGVAVRALRGAAYFDGDGVVRAVAVLLTWVLGALLVQELASRGQRRRA